MEFIKKNKILFTVLILVILGMLSVLLFSANTPTVKTTDPLNNETNVSPKKQIKIVFDKSISNNTPEIVLMPEINTTLRANQNTLVITPRGDLLLDTQYFLRINDGRTKKELATITFKTKMAQGDSAEVFKAEEMQKNDYPLTPYYPPDNAPFYFTYSGPKKLKVFLKGNQQNAKAEFIKWVGSLGVNLSTHQVEYLTPP
jgi:hypothetical protein